MKTIPIKQLSDETIEILRQRGYKESSLYCVKKIQRQLIRAHESQGKENFDHEIFLQYTDSLKVKFESGGHTERRYFFLNRCASYMEQYWKSGTVDTTPRRTYPDTPECFKGIFDKYSAEFSKNHHPKSAKRIHPHLFWLEKHGYCDLSAIDENILRAYMLEHSLRVRPCSLNNERRYLKHFYRFLYEQGITAKEFNLLFSNPVASETKIKKPVPLDELAQTLKLIDRSTPKGKRDYALILLAAMTGLRSVDVVKLKRSDIDWNKGEIRIIQAKTKRPVSLPLTEDVGEALKVYLLEARPECDSDEIFLTSRAPHKPYESTRAAGDIFDSRRKEAGYSSSGVHGLRRALAKNMISVGVPATTVAQVLGDKQLNSIKQYVAIDTDNLAECSLGFDDIPIAPAPVSELKSGFAKDIDAFFEYRMAMGFKKKPYYGKLKKFDLYCAEHFPELTMLTKEAVMGWWMETTAETDGITSVKASAIRMFAKYLLSMGKDAYVLPTSMIAVKSSFTPYILNDDELKALFYQLDVFQGKGHFKPFTKEIAPIMFRLQYTCGLRPNEVRMLKRSDINLDNGEMLITNTKRNKDRIVVMSPEMLELCRTYEVKRLLFDKDGDWFFPRKPGECYVPAQMESIFKFCWRKANPELSKENLPRLRCYDLRHRFASAILHKWLDEKRDLNSMLPYLRAHMGHSKLDETAYYIHILPENLLGSRGVNWEELDDVGVGADVWQR